MLSTIFSEILPLVSFSEFKQSLSMIKNPYKKGEDFTTNEETIAI